FSMTINKAQGQSVKYVGLLEFQSGTFTHGQFYVAVSQVTLVHNVKAILDSKNVEATTKNIVYPEVLLK
ncbi:helicase, partial [Crucibulum laeve]